MDRNEDTDEFSCFDGQKYELEIEFTHLSGQQVKSAFDFADLKIKLNSKPVEDINNMGRSIEFFLEFTSPGTNELVLEYKNIKKEWTINVSSSKISKERTNVYLRQKDNDYETSQEFRMKEEIEVCVQFRNDKGLGVPFKGLEGLDLTWKVLEVGQKRVRGLGGFVELEKEMYLGDGKVLFCSFKMSNEMGSGVNEVVVFGDDFLKKCKFILKKCQ